MLAQLKANHPEELRVVYRHFPLVTIHDKAAMAGQAAELAGEQGAFWEMHDLLFQRFSEWAGLTPTQFEDWLEDAAIELGLDGAALRIGLEAGRYHEEMQEAFATAVQSGIPGTPFMLINGIPYQLPLQLNYLEAVVRVEAQVEYQYAGPPPLEIDLGSTYTARLRLNIGEVLIQLYPNSAPMAVNSFVFLAEAGWFDGNAFYWIVPGEFAMSGDPTETGFGGPGYHLDTELDPALDFSEPGMLALDSSGPGTQGSRFMITLRPMPEFDGSRTIFGRVLSGLDRLQGLDPRDPLEDLLLPPQAIIQAVEIQVGP